MTHYESTRSKRSQVGPNKSRLRPIMSPLGPSR